MSAPYPPGALPSAYVSGPWPASKEVDAENQSNSYSELAAHLRLPDGSPDYLRLILSADIYDLVKATPLTPAINLSSRLGCEVLMKREDLQPVFSFKLRGAFNMMRQLSEEQKWKGVIACSAGNHAQGVALSGAHLSVPCTIVMPMGTPAIKTQNVARLGAKVVLHGVNFDEAKAECSRLAESYGLAIVPPFDEPRVIAGQGTTAVEMCRQTDMSKVDAVFCCVGGGGLLAGVAAYIKRIAPPSVKVIGVETYDGDALARSLEQGKRVTLDEVGLFSDGTAVRVVGQETFRLCHGLVDGIVRVDTDEICAAIRDVFEDTRSIPEPAGALAVAGMKRYVAMHGLQGSGKRFITAVSGANMNFSRLRFVAERAELGDQKEVLLMVDIPEKPGSFLRLINHIIPRDITEFSYRLNGSDRAHIFLSFMLKGLQNGQHADALPTPAVSSSLANPSPTSSPGRVPSPKNPTDTSAESCAPVTPLQDQAKAAQSSARRAELQSILDAIEAEGDMSATDVSTNEMAKSHARYMVGGRLQQQNGSRPTSMLNNERLFQFTFPERPGSLLKFLNGLNKGWNVSLFNYRNHGSDTAKILVAIQVGPNDGAALDTFLENLGYLYREETDNEAYVRFMR